MSRDAPQKGGPPPRPPTGGERFGMRPKSQMPSPPSNRPPPPPSNQNPKK